MTSERIFGTPFPAGSRPLIPTPFYPSTAPSNRNQLWFAWDRYILVEVFEDVYAEIRAVRENTGVLDKWPLAVTRISGREAVRAVDHLVTRDVTDLSVGRATYALWCTSDGKLASDGIVARTEESTFLITGAPSSNLLRMGAQGFDVLIEDLTDQVGYLALQGPTSHEVLALATGTSWDDMPRFGLRRATLGDVEVDVWCMGFTGEAGFEIWVTPETAAAAWSSLLEYGVTLGIRPVGHMASHIMRVEAGFVLPGPDFTPAGPDYRAMHMSPEAMAEDYVSSPFELGMGDLVDLSKEDFVGRDALLREQDAGGPPRRLVRLEVEWRDILDLHARLGAAPTLFPQVHTDPVSLERAGETIGRATSITWAPTLRKMIGFGHVPRDMEESSSDLSLQWRVEGEGGRVRARFMV